MKVKDISLQVINSVILYALFYVNCCVYVFFKDPILL